MRRTLEPHQRTFTPSCSHDLLCSANALLTHAHSQTHKRTYHQSSTQSHSLFLSTHIAKTSLVYMSSSPQFDTMRALVRTLTTHLVTGGKLL